ncbi:YncE family protein [Candidatus Bipolaricaulota bacterium]
MQKIGRVVLGVLLLLVILAGTVGMQSGKTTMLYEGSFLGTPYGGLVDGVFTMRFAIYDASSGGNQLWPAVAGYEQHPLVIVMAGKFSADLGSLGQPMTDAVSQATEAHVQISVCQPAGFDCAGFELLPTRFPLGSGGGLPQTTTPGIGGVLPEGTSSHDHWGETWEGTELGLRLNNVGTYTSIVSLASQGNGLLVEAASGNGVRVENAALSGLSIRQAGFEGISIGEASLDGISIGNVGENGLRISNVGGSPVSMFPGDKGFLTTGSGVSIGGSSGFGMWIGWAGEDGVHVNSALEYGVHASSRKAAGIHGESIEGPGGEFSSIENHALVADGTTLLGGRNPRQIGMLKWYEANLSQETIKTDDHPAGLAFDGESIWVGHENAQAAIRISPSDGHKETYSWSTLELTDRGLVCDGVRIWGATGNPEWLVLVGLDPDDKDMEMLFSQAPAGDSDVAVTGLAFDGIHVWVATLEAVYQFNVSEAILLNETEVQSVQFRRMGSEVRMSPIAASALAFDGTNMWVANPVTNNVVRLRPSDLSSIGSSSVGRHPYALAFDGANMWVANYEDGTVNKLRASDGQVLGTYRVGMRPAALVFDGFHIWVANEGDNTLTKLRAIDGSLVGTYQTGRSPCALVFDGTHVWVANHDDSTLMKF